jgi:hypothetical protein
MACIHDDPSVEEALLDGAADIFERGGKKTAENDEETARDLHAKIGELTVANNCSPSAPMSQICG